MECPTAFGEQLDNAKKNKKRKANEIDFFMSDPSPSRRHSLYSDHLKKPNVKNGDVKKEEEQSHSFLEIDLRAKFFVFEWQVKQSTKNSSAKAALLELVRRRD